MSCYSTKKEKPRKKQTTTRRKKIKNISTCVKYHIHEYVLLLTPIDRNTKGHLLQASGHSSQPVYHTNYHLQMKGLV